MNIIFVSRKHGRARDLSPGHGVLLTLSMVLLLLFGAIFYLGYRSALQSNDVFRSEHFIQEWQTELKNKGQAVVEVRRQTDEQIRALTVRVAQLQARLIRLDALGEYLVKSRDLDQGEFNFSSVPAVGGPVEDRGQAQYQPPAFVTIIDDLAKKIEARERELDLLTLLLVKKDFDSDRYLSGRPIRKGWLSSGYGRRTDPFTGKPAWHKGVDFAGKENSDVISVAAGVVTWSGERYGYGNLVEINHGGEYATRYAHANQIMVNVGDVVKKGQVIAQMGSSGRSTGPHVHFEVLKNRKQVDPSRYIRRRSG